MEGLYEPAVRLLPRLGKENGRASTGTPCQRLSKPLNSEWRRSMGGGGGSSRPPTIAAGASETSHAAVASPTSALAALAASASAVTGRHELARCPSDAIAWTTP